MFTCIRLSPDSSGKKGTSLAGAAALKRSTAKSAKDVAEREAKQRAYAVARSKREAEALRLKRSQAAKKVRPFPASL